MDSPRGRILHVHPESRPPRVVVEVTSPVQCARCAAGKGCGAGILGGGESRRRIDALLPRGLELHVGDHVAIELAPDSVLGAAAIAYGLPLCGAVVGATCAWAAGTGDFGASVAALAGIVAGVIAGRRQLRRSACLERFTPIVASRLAEPGG